MALAFDAVSRGGGAGAGPFTMSHTTSGADRLLVVGFSYYHYSNTMTALTYNGVAFSSVPGGSVDNGDYHVRLFYQVAPTLGANTLSISFSGTGVYDVGIGAISFTGADQTTPVGTAVTATGNDATPTASVLSASDEIVVDTTIITHSGTYSVGAGQTSRWNAVAGAGYIKHSGSTAPGAGPVVMSWANSSIQLWALAAVPIKPVAAVGGSTVPVLLHHLRQQGIC